MALTTAETVGILTDLYNEEFSGDECRNEVVRYVLN